MSDFDDDFWQALDELVAGCELVIDRPRGSVHPRYPDMRYEVDYGYLSGTRAMDGGGVDVWRGSDPAGRIDAVICTVDLVKRDTEVKLLIGCTEEETQAVLRFHNDSSGMKGLLVRRQGTGHRVGTGVQYGR